VKLEKNTSDTCVVLSEAYEREAMSGINGLKRLSISKSQMKTMLITFFDIKANVHFFEFIIQV